MHVRISCVYISLSAVVHHIILCLTGLHIWLWDTKVQHMLTYINCNSYDLTLPTLSKLPAFLKFTNYVNPTEYLRSPMAYAVGQSQFEWLADHKKQQSWFNSYMASRREGKQNWFDIYPVNRVIQEAARFDDVHTRHHSHGHENGGEEAEHHDKTPHRNEEKVFLVDIGGNQGHDLVKLRKRLGSEFRAKLVLQDLPSVLESSSNTDGIEKMAYSFLEPQPVKGMYHPPFQFRYYM